MSLRSGVRRSEVGLGGDLAVLIPTRCEARLLPGCLDSLGATTLPIVVADGVSTDATRQVAAAHPLRPRVLAVASGRHAQLNAALAAVSADWVLILPADARLRGGALARITACCRQLRGAAGCLTLHPDDRRWQHRVRARWSRLRSVLTGGAYLDQAPLFRRQAALHVGGFRACGAYDSADLGWRLRHAGPFTVLPEPVVISCREYRRDGWWKTTLHHQRVRVWGREVRSPEVRTSDCPELRQEP